MDSVDWYELGVALTQSIDALFSTLSGFFKEFDWLKAGESLADAVHGMFEGIDWIQVGEVIGDGLTGVGDIIGSFADNFPWAEIGDKIAFGANAMFDNINWISIGDSLNAMFDGTLESLLSFIEGFSWSAHGTELANGIENFINNLPLQELGQTLRESILGILKFIKPAIKDKKIWSEAGSKFADMLNELFGNNDEDDNIWDSLSTAIVSLAEGVITSLKNFVSTFSWGEQGDVFGDALFKLIDFFPLNDLGTALEDLLTGALEFMYGVFSNRSIFTTLGAKLAQFLNGVFAPQGSNKPLWDSVGKTANELLLSALAFGDSFVSGFDAGQAADSIKRALNKISWDTIATEAWGLLKTALGKTGDFINTLLADESNSHWDPWKNMYVPDESSIGTKLGKKIAKAWAEIPWKQFFSDLMTGTKNLLDNIGDALEEFSQNGTIGKAIADVLNEVFKTDQSWWESVGKAGNKLILNVLQIGQDFVDGFDEKQAARSITTALGEIKWETIASNAWKLIKSAFAKTGSFLDALLNEDVDSARSIDEAYEKLMFNKQSFGYKLGYRISKAIEGINWKQFGTYIGNGARALFDNFSEALNQLTKKNESTGTSPLEDAVTNFLKGVDLDSFAESLKTALQSIKTVIKQVLGSVINEALNELLDDPNGFNNGYTDSLFASDPLMGAGSSDGWAGSGKKLADSIVDGMVNELGVRQKDVSDSMTATFMDPFKTEVEGANGFDIGSPSKRTKSLGEFIMQGFINGLKSSWLTILQTVSQGVQDVITLVLNPLKNLVEIGIPGKVSSMKTTFETGFQSIQQTVSTAVQNIVTLVLQPLDNLANTGIPLKMAAANNSFETGWNTIQNTVKTAYGNMYYGLYQTMDTANSTTIPSKMSAMNTAFATGWAAINTTVKQAYGNMLYGLYSALDTGATTSIPNKMQSFNNGFQSGWRNINSTTYSAMNTFYDTIRSKMDSLGSYLPSKFRSIFNDIVRMANSLIDRIESASNSVIRALNNALRINLEWHVPDWAGGGTYWWRWNPNLPTISVGNVSYLAKGGIIDSASLLGFEGKNPIIGGEEGREAILPLETHTEWMDDLADRVNARSYNENPISYSYDSDYPGVNDSSNIGDVLKYMSIIVDSLREIERKDTSVEVSTAQIAKAQQRTNRRAGITIIPVGT